MFLLLQKKVFKPGPNILCISRFKGLIYCWTAFQGFQNGKIDENLRSESCSVSLLNCLKL